MCEVSAADWKVQASTLRLRVALETAGVERRKDEGVIDEIPTAYEDIDAVMAAQSDIVEVVATLKQILYVKG